jgi:hypothetical protein
MSERKYMYVKSIIISKYTNFINNTNSEILKSKNFEAKININDKILLENEKEYLVVAIYFNNIVVVESA